MPPAAADENLRTRTVRGAVLLAGQRAATLAISGLGGIALARLLGPSDFGVWAILAFAIGLGVTFSDLGLGAALVQRRELDPAVSLPAAFAANLGLALVLGGATAALAPVVARALDLGPDATPALRVLALLVPLAALRMPAVVLLERRLAYLPLTLGDTLDTVVFVTAAVVAAWSGAGVWSFVIGAVLARAAALAVVWRAAGWRWRLGRPDAHFGAVLRFGLFYLGSSVITLFRDAVVPTFVATSAGIAAVGMLNWAATVTFLPLSFVSIAGRVLFPALSRLQGERARFAEAAERALNRVALVVYPAAALLFAAAEPIVRLVYGSTWLPAVPAVRYFCVTVVVGGTGTVLVHALYALGRADLVFRLNVLWAALVWIFTLLLVPRLGFVGFAAASALTACSMSLTAIVLRRLAPVRVLRAVRVPLLAACVAGAALGPAAAWWAHDLASLVGVVAGALVLYGALAWISGGATWRDECRADLRAAWQR